MDKKPRPIAYILLLILFLGTIYGIFMTFKYQELRKENAEQSRELRKFHLCDLDVVDCENKEEDLSMLIVGGSDLLPVSIPSFEDPILLGMIEEIIMRESGGDPNICNKKYGCKAGMGLTQLIPSTVRYCERKIGKEIDPFDPDDNVECAIWLLKNEGIRHWEGDGTWGSGPYPQGKSY